MPSLLRILLYFLLLFALTPVRAVPTTPDSDFTDNGDGTVTHKFAGLTWKRCTEGQVWDGKTCTGSTTKFTYDQGFAVKSNFAGYTDWRVPNIAELMTIIEKDRYNPAINTTQFPNTPKNTHSVHPSEDTTFLTSSYIGNYESQSGKWWIDFYEGNEDSGLRSGNFQVRLVRGGQLLDPSGEYTPTKHFTDHGDGTVTHNTTGLMWQRCGQGQTWGGSTCNGELARFTYEQAVELKSNFANHSDWRLPNANELASIIEYKAHRPAINSTIFPNVPKRSPDSEFWSASSYVRDKEADGLAVTIDFYNGFSANQSKEFRKFAIRLVRSGKPVSSTNTDAIAEYGFATGDLTINDVDVNGVHFWAKLHDFGGLKFGLQDYHAINNAVPSGSAHFDLNSRQLTISKVKVGNQNYSGVLQQQNDGSFTVLVANIL